MVRIGSGPIDQRDLRDLSRLSGGAEEYNRPERIVRPAEFIEIPIFEDHVGPVRPHIINMSSDQKQTFIKK